MPILSSAQRLELAAAPDPDPVEPKPTCRICGGPATPNLQLRREDGGSFVHPRCAPAPPRRRKRPAAPRSKTFARKHHQKLVAHLGLEPLTVEDRLALLERPRTWGECRGKTGPCPWVGCSAHRYLDVTPTGGIKLNYPELEGPLELEHPCVLRIAEEPRTLDEVGQRMNLTREAARLIERRALLKAKQRAGNDF